MIVNNFISSSSGALPGVDFLARVSKLDANNAGESLNFSDVLDAPGRSDASTSSVGAASQKRPLARSGAPARSADQSSDLNLSGQDPQVTHEGVIGAVGSDAPAALGGLDDSSPLIRDPRLDDPAELALEAAAMSLAAGLLQKAEVPLLQPAVAAESQLDSGSGQGGAQAQEKEQGPSMLVPLPVSVAVPSILKVDGTSQSTLAAAEQKSVAPRTGDPKAQPQEQIEAVGISSSFVGKTPAHVIPSIVVKANPVQSAALSVAKAGSLFPQSLELLPGLPKVTGLVPSQNSIAQGAPELSVETSPELSVEMSSASLNRGAIVEAGVLQSLPDAEFLASAPPSNPAAAFFAGQALQQQPKIASVQVQLETGTEEPSAEVSAGESEGVVHGETEALGLVRQEKQGAVGESNPKPAKPPTPEVKAELKPEGKHSAAGEPEVGTFGAEEGVVERETSFVRARSEASSTSVTSEVEASFSQVAPSAELPNGAASQSGVQARPAHEATGAPSRPTVLPPVQTKASELFNVVQNALERARSENPSHLAVEVTLDDGSSFGLEVRMSASGLQASFRSESQPLLKALESNWAVYLAKETADAKVVSAAFEGRSGFGGFSNEGSNAGERRQQLEDNASAASLAGRDARDSRSEKPQVESSGINLASTDGMALYA